MPEVFLSFMYGRQLFLLRAGVCSLEQRQPAACREQAGISALPSPLRAAACQISVLPVTVALRPCRPGRLTLHLNPKPGGGDEQIFVISLREA